MKKEKRTFKGTMRSFLSSVKTFTLKALMFFARILIRLIAIISMGGMMIIPFLTFGILIYRYVRLFFLKNGVF